MVGGASSFSVRKEESAGQRNINIAHRILNEWEIPFIEEVTGGCSGRKLVFYSESNKTEISELDDCLALCKIDGGVCKQRIVSGHSQ